MVMQTGSYCNDNPMEQRSALSMFGEEFCDTAHNCLLAVIQLRQGKFPIILAEGLSVNAFQGLLLGSRYDTSIEVDPVGHRAKVLNDCAPTEELDDLELVFGLRKNTAVNEQRTMIYYTVACVCNDVQLDSGDSVDDAQGSSLPNDKGKKSKIG
nr:uncharacterized protein LOC109183623 [Ipomoea batatas]